jgi:alpha-D-xyloside xylohydrolase
MHKCTAILGVTALLGLSGSASAETLSNYRSHTSDVRSMTVTSDTGQTLRLTAYGDYLVRVRAIRSGETFFADDRYEMVDPASHAGMGGSLSVVDGGASFTLTTAAADGVRIVLQKSPLRVELYRKSDGALLAKEDAAHGMSWSGANNSVIKETFAPAAAGEHFFKAGHGTFGRVAKLDQTGAVVASDRYAEQAPLIVPFYLSTGGYGVFFNTTFDTTFNFGSGGTYEFSADEHNVGSARPQIDYFVIVGPEFAKILDRYTQLTGRPRLPQESIFGLQLSDKNFPDVSDAAWWQAKITAHRNAGYPFDHQANDNRWREGDGTRCGGPPGTPAAARFQFSAARWPDPAGYRTWAAVNGVTLSLDYNRCISVNMSSGQNASGAPLDPWIPGPQPGYGFQASDVASVADNASVPDWSNTAARAWLWKVFWGRALNPALGFPGDGLWLDEVDAMSSIPKGADTAVGWKWSELANYYIFLLQKGVVQEGWNPNVGGAKRPWSWSRGSVAGAQRFGHYWTGDIDSSYADMQNQIRAMQVAGLGGFPYFDHDGGGFQGVTISDGMYRNWVAGFASLAPIFKPHGAGNTSTSGAAASRWPLDQNAVRQADFMTYAKLRYRMMPYIYTNAYVAHATGMPMARAMVIDYQNDSRAYGHDLQYMWGPSLLVMPVTTDTNGAVQNVWLPAGDTWYNFWSDVPTTGSDAADTAYATSTGQTILFVKAGAILPEYPYAQSTFFMNKAQLELEVYAGKDGAFTLYEDDGKTESFSGGAQSFTSLAFTQAATRVTVGHPAGTYAGAPTARRYVVRIHGLSSPAGMRVNGGPTLPPFATEGLALANGSGEVWDAAKKLLTVVTPSIGVVVGGGVAATVEPSGDPFPGAPPPPPPPAFVSTYGSMNLRGTMNGWGTTAMALVADHLWQVPVTLSANTAYQYKYDAFGNWAGATNWGDNNNDKIGDAGGANIAFTATAAGSYLFQFDDSARAYAIVPPGGTPPPPPPPPSPPPVPTGVSAMATSSSAITVSWVASSGATSYTVSRAVNGGSYSDLKTVTALSLNDTGLTASTAYAYRVVASNGSATSAPSLEAKATTLPAATLKSNFPTMFVRGTMNNWGTSGMTLVADDTWQVTLSLSANTAYQYKFDALGNWASTSNWGDNNNDKVGDVNAANIGFTTSSAGRYTFTFNDSTRAYSAAPAP